jgi:hypothetical protein
VCLPTTNREVMDRGLPHLHQQLSRYGFVHAKRQPEAANKAATETAARSGKKQENRESPFPSQPSLLFHFNFWIFPFALPFTLSWHKSEPDNCESTAC